MEKSIHVNISDHPILNVKRRIEIFGFQQLWSEEQIKVFKLCHHYTNDDELISTQSLKSFERILTASNIRKVDVVDGMQLIETSGGTYFRLDNQQEVSNGSIIGQFDFFDMLVKNTALDIPNLLIQVIQLEDALNQSYDK